MTTKTLAVLGRPDPEMEAIERIFRAAGVPVAYACEMQPALPGSPAGDAPADREAVRVNGSTAYRSDGLTYRSPAEARGHECPDRILAIECGPAPGYDGWGTGEWWGCGGADPELVAIDHHRPGDPGYGRPPEEFLPASSIGQVVAWLARGGLWFPGESLPNVSDLTPGTFWPTGANRGWCVSGADGHDYAVPDDLVLTAAADHCLAAAYAGKCHGADPVAIREWRVREVLTARGAGGRPESRTVAEVERSIDAAIGEIEWRLGAAMADAEPYASPPDDRPGRYALIGGVIVADCRGEHVPDLPEAACILGIGYLADAPGRPGEGRKVVLGGCGEGTAPGTAPVEEFLTGWAEDQGLVRPYGDPARGFAGAYVE